MDFIFRVPVRIIFGRGAVKNVGSEVKKLGGKRIFLVADHNIEKISKRIKNLLLREGLKVTIFDEIKSEPTVEIADKATGLAKRKNCNLVIGVGGGSSMDIAKAVSILLTNKGKAKDYQGQNMVKAPGVPKIMIPTTAGTGSEVTITSVLIREKIKAGINSPYLFAELAILDPTLTLSLPPEVTASTGMDALTHAIEASTSKSTSPMVNLFAFKAIELINQNLLKAVKDGKDIEAREGMLFGSLLAGIALANAGVGAAHALAYPLGGVYNISHGVANALLLPDVMDFNLKSNPKQFYRIDLLMGKKRAKDAVIDVRELSRKIKIIQRLRDLKVPKSAIAKLAEDAMKVTGPILNNPRKITLKDAIKLYQKAF